MKIENHLLISAHPVNFIAFIGRNKTKYWKFFFEDMKLDIYGMQKVEMKELVPVNIFG